MHKNILVAPISGCYFGNQLGAMLHLSKYNYKPDIILAGSGGVVSSMVYASSDFQYNSMIRTARELNSKMYIKSWVSEYVDFIPSYTIGFFKGTLYDTSCLLPVYIKRLINNAMLNELEMWILAFNATKAEPGLFCTCTEDRAIIKNNNNEFKLYKTLTYLDGDIDKFIKVSSASASIPSVVPPINIDGDSYTDCGLAHASPLTPLSIDIQNIEQWHIVYVSSYNMENFDITGMDGSIFDIVGYATKSIIHSNNRTDKYKCYELLSSRGKIIEERITLEDYFKRRKDWYSSVIDIYPKENNRIEITDFNGDDVVNAMINVEIEIRVWYVLSKTARFSEEN